MSKFVCKNEPCEAFGISINYADYVVKIDRADLKTKYYNNHNEELVCETCGHSLTQLIDENIEGFSVNIGKFNGMTSDEKKAMLKKRANDKFKESSEMRDYKQMKEEESNGKY